MIIEQSVKTQESLEILWNTILFIPVIVSSDSKKKNVLKLVDVEF